MNATHNKLLQLGKNISIGSIMILLSACQHTQPVSQTTPQKTEATQNTTNTAIDTSSLHASSTQQEPDTNNISANNSLNNVVSFQQAAEYTLTHSDKLLAAQANWQASKLRAEALNSLRLPTVMINGRVGKYHISKDISTEPLQDRLQDAGTGLIQKLPPQLAGLLYPSVSNAMSKVMTRIPDSVNISRTDTFNNIGVTAAMPLYTGGRINAIQQIAHSYADTNASEILSTREELLQTLVKYYFRVQLAKRVVGVRQSAYTAVRGHQYAAKRMLDTGLISKVEYLQAAAALSDANFHLEKARNNLELAQQALTSFLQGNDTIAISTDLFVSNQSLPPLRELQQQALQHHPAFAKISAKHNQAKAMKQLSDAAWKPNVSAFGSHQLNNNNNWIVGINAQWILHSSIDRSKMQQASQQTINQTEAIQRQAQRDIQLLVEKNWVSATNARSRYYSLGKEEQLAKQVVKLRLAGFKEGINTVIEVNDAQAKLVGIRTQRANASYEYVTSLADLFASVGDIKKFINYIPHK